MASDLPLFAFAAQGFCTPGPAYDPFEGLSPMALAPARRRRMPKPLAPKGEAIWPHHAEMMDAAAEAIAAALRAARQASKPKPRALDPLIAALRANPDLCRAISQPEPLTPDTDIGAADTGSAFIARTETALEVVYRGPREHLEAALSAISASSASLPVMVRCAAAQLLPLRSASVARGVCGWRAIIPIRARAEAPTLGA